MVGRGSLSSSFSDSDFQVKKKKKKNPKQRETKEGSKEMEEKGRKTKFESSFLGASAKA